MSTQDTKQAKQPLSTINGRRSEKVTGLAAAAPLLLQFALAHLLWEFELVQRDDVWNRPTGYVHLPPDLADRMVQLQQLRTAALRAIGGGDVQ